LFIAQVRSWLEVSSIVADGWVPKNGSVFQRVTTTGVPTLTRWKRSITS
jgi:hypothetical protein